MAEAFNSQQVMSGTQGEVWINDKYMAQVTAFKAEVNLTKEEVNQVKKWQNSTRLPGGKAKAT